MKAASSWARQSSSGGRSLRSKPYCQVEWRSRGGFNTFPQVAAQSKLLVNRCHVCLCHVDASSTLAPINSSAGQGHHSILASRLPAAMQRVGTHTGNGSQLDRQPWPCAYSHSLRISLKPRIPSDQPHVPKSAAPEMHTGARFR